MGGRWIGNGRGGVEGPGDEAQEFDASEDAGEGVRLLGGNETNRTDFLGRGSIAVAKCAGCKELVSVV